MPNQKGFALLPVLVSIIVVSVIVTGYFYYRSLPHELASNPDSVQDIQENTKLDEGSQEGLDTVTDVGYVGNDGEITYSGEWKKAKFPDEYNLSVNIFYPAGWEFNCCGDTDGYSVHATYPVSSATDLSINPLISVFDYGLSGCPGDKESCGMEERQKVSAGKYMSNEIRSIDKNGTGSSGMTGLKKATSIKLNNFVGDVPVYSGLSSTFQPIELYLLQSSKGVVGVVFQQPRAFDATLKMDFLNKLTPN